MFITVQYADVHNTTSLQPSGYVQSLPAPVRRRIKALKKLQLEATKIEAKFYEEVILHTAARLSLMDNVAHCWTILDGVSHSCSPKYPVSDYCRVTPRYTPSSASTTSSTRRYTPGGEASPGGSTNRPTRCLLALVHTVMYIFL